jgi:hypothetical protein
MIRLDGYYLDTPTHYVDYVAGNNKRAGLVHSAYLFSEDNIVKRLKKESRNEIEPFNQEDFLNAYCGEFSLNEDYLSIVFDKGEKWELKKKFKISGDQIVCVESNSAAGTDEICQFHQW